MGRHHCSTYIKDGCTPWQHYCSSYIKGFTNYLYFPANTPPVFCQFSAPIERYYIKILYKGLLERYLRKIL
jgi:hypothetical protein